MPPDDPDALNLRAYLALQGAALDWRDDVARLLRSDAPVSRLVRNLLAAAVENVSEEGTKLDLAGHKAARDRFVGVVIRHEWMDIGRWVTDFRMRHPSGPSAVAAAAEHFGLGLKKVEAALAFFNKANLWVDQAMESEAGRDMGREWVESLYHSITVNPEIKQVNEPLIRDMGLSH